MTSSLNIHPTTRLSDHLTTFIFFSGKGGVGKTSMACTHAVRFADEGKRTLIVTTDPALTDNIADFRKVRDDIAREIPALLRQVA